MPLRVYYFKSHAESTNFVKILYPQNRKYLVSVGLILCYPQNEEQWFSNLTALQYELE